MEASAFSPAHITGFFSAYYDPSRPVSSGSTGAGFSISKGVLTRVTAEPSSTSSFELEVNGKKCNHTPVSNEVARRFLKLTNKEFSVKVHHSVEVPVGGGFGSSAASALSLALALSKALPLNLTTEEAAQVAHVAEVVCGTGLGGVSAECVGGLEMRISPGAPGVGEIRRIPVGGDYSSVTLCLGGLSTKEILEDQNARNRLSEVGRDLLHYYAENPSVQSFLKTSRMFAEKSGLLTERLRRVLNEADKAGLVCSMAMLGETVFTLAGPEKVSAIVEAFEKHADSPDQIMVAPLDMLGARLI